MSSGLFDCVMDWAGAKLGVVAGLGMDLESRSFAHDVETTAVVWPGVPSPDKLLFSGTIFTSDFLLMSFLKGLKLVIEELESEGDFSWVAFADIRSES